MKKKRSFVRALISDIISAAVILLAGLICYKLDIPNPVIVLVIFMIIIVVLLRRKSNHAFEELKEQNHRLKEQNHELEDESDHDSLTGIYNRRGGDKRVAICLSGNTDSSFRASLAAIDIDNFKQINDMYGHAAGDRAIQQLITQMQKIFGKYSILIRNGGDEFQAFLYGNDITEIEQKIMKFADEIFHVSFNGTEFDFHISCGYAIYPEQAKSMADLYRKADIALYDVKLSGKHKALPYTWDAGTARPEKFMLTVTSLSNYLPVAFMVYRADETEEILIASTSLIRMCGCDSFSDLISYTGGSFRGFVHPDDVEQVENSIEDQIKKNPQNLDEVDYRILTRDGRTVRVHDLGRRIYDPGLGELFYVALNDKDAFHSQENS